MQPDLLSQLNDIQTPEPIGWWPIAWGWYVLAIIFILVTIYLLKKVRDNIKLKAAKKQALTALNHINNTQPPLQQVTLINNILKRALLVYAAREDVANLTGQKLASYLNQYNKSNVDVDPNLLSLAYQPNCNHEQAELLKQQVICWISTNLPLTSKSLQTKPEVKHV